MTVKNAPKPMTKVQLKQHLAEKTGLAAKQISEVLDELAAICTKELTKKTTFVIPGIVRMVKIKKPATKEKQGINPFTKEPMTIKAKPARNVVKGRPVKALKDAVSS